MARLSLFLNKLPQSAIRAIFPPRCGGCGGWYDGLFCAFCRPQVRLLQAPLCEVCGSPFDALAKDAHLCAECRPSRNHKPPAFAALRAPFIFEGPLREAVHRYKYQGQTSLTTDLAAEMVRFWQEDCGGTLQPPHCDIVTAVPLHWWRGFRRGYNQSELLARQISVQLDIPWQPLLQRTRPTRTQIELPREQRALNVKNAFSVPEKARPMLSRKTVLLIDDVCTTGVTLRECAAILKKEGAHAVYALTLARRLAERQQPREPEEV